MTAGIWALIDRRPGNASQVLGVAEALGLPFTAKKLAFTRLMPLACTPAQAFRFGLDADSQVALAAPWPELVIAAGRRAGQVTLHLARSSGGRIRTVQLMHPGPPIHAFSLVALPLHDCAPDAANIVRTICPPSRVTPGFLATARDEWEATLAPLPRPRVVLLVGGPLRRTDEAADAFAAMLAASVQFVRASGGSLLATTSRRTPSRIAAVMQSRHDVPHRIHCWARNGDNPYAGFLGSADYLVVTGDSISMCAEASATGRPVLIFDAPGWTRSKHRAFHSRLFEAGVARRFDGRFAAWRYQPIFSADRIAAEIRKRGLAGAPPGLVGPG